MVAGIVFGLIGLAVAGFVGYLFVAPLIMGRYSPPDERRRENRHKFRRQAGTAGRQ